MRAFLDQYVSYLRVHARHELDQVAARVSAAAGPCGDRERHPGGLPGGEQEQRWREAEAEAKTSIETYPARLFALKNRDGYKDHEKLGLRRGHLEKEKRELADGPARLGRARANVADQSAEAARVGDRLGEVGRAATGTRAVSPKPRTAPASAVTVHR